MSENTDNQNIPSENELTENELDQVAGGGLSQPQGSNKLIGLLLPAVNVAVGDVNGDNLVNGDVIAINQGTLGK